MAVVTLSRMPGALGDEIGRQLAPRLGFRLVGRQELVSMAATLGESGALERSPEVRERSPSFWERLNEERRRNSTVLRNVVLRLAEEDDVVIVGLGAGQFLRGLHHVLRVQIVAPTEVRLDRIMEHGDEERRGPLSREQAREVLRQRDRDIGGYVRYLFNVDWTDPVQWDLVINTGRFSVTESVEAIAAVVEKGLLVPRDEDRSRLRDLAMAGRIESMLLNHPDVWVSGLRVKAAAGRVRLEGEVVAEEDRELVEDVVRATDGVVAVENDLRVQPPPLTGI